MLLMESRLDAYEGLHLFNDAMHKATLYLESVAKTGMFDQKRLDYCRFSISELRSATNVYLIDEIQRVERRSLAMRETFSLG